MNLFVVHHLSIFTAALKKDREAKQQHQASLQKQQISVSSTPSSSSSSSSSATTIMQMNDICDSSPSSLSPPLLLSKSLANNSKTVSKTATKLIKSKLIDSNNLNGIMGSTATAAAAATPKSSSMKMFNQQQQPNQFINHHCNNNYHTHHQNDQPYNLNNHSLQTAAAAAAATYTNNLNNQHQHYECGCLSPSTKTTTTTAEMTAAIIAIESMMESDLILQALNGFLLILTCDGEVFYTSNTVETYLGFHQSDICHQSVYELVHSEDREELQRHLMWNSNLPSDRSSLKLSDILLNENCHYLERNFTVRFRCLLDNTSGFLRLDVRGRIKVLYGQNHKSEEPPMALFAVCTPFGPPSLLEMPANEKASFKSKHKLDFSMISMEPRGRQLLGYNETDLINCGGYDLIHQDDLFYVASAHQELLKTGASVLIAYRLVSKDCLKWQWLQTSARLVYKNSKPDFILCTHRPLMEEEGQDLLSKRTMDFKVTYLDGGLGAITLNRTNSYNGIQHQNFLNDSHPSSSLSSSSSSASTTIATTVSATKTTGSSSTLSGATNNKSNDNNNNTKVTKIKSERSTSRSSSSSSSAATAAAAATNSIASTMKNLNVCDNITNNSKLQYSNDSSSDNNQQQSQNRNSRSNNSNQQSSKSSSKSYNNHKTNGSSSSSSSTNKKTKTNNNNNNNNNSSCHLSSVGYLETSNSIDNNNFNYSESTTTTTTTTGINYFERNNNSQQNSNQIITTTTSPNIIDISNVNMMRTLSTIATASKTSVTTTMSPSITSNYMNSNNNNNNNCWTSAIHHNHSYHHHHHHHTNPYSSLLDESGNLHLASEAPSHTSAMFTASQHSTHSAYSHHHHSGHHAHHHSLSIGGIDCGTAAAAAAVAAAAYNAAYHHPTATTTTSASIHQSYSQNSASHNTDSSTLSSSSPSLHGHSENGRDQPSSDTDHLSHPNYSTSLNIILPSSDLSNTAASDIPTASDTVSNEIGLLSRASTSFFSAENLLNYSSSTRNGQTSNYGPNNACNNTTSDSTDIYAVAAAAIHGQRRGQYVMGGHAVSAHPYSHYGTASNSYHHQLQQNSGMTASGHHHPHAHYGHENLTYDENSAATNIGGSYLRNPVTGLMYSDTFSSFHDSTTNNTTTAAAASNPYRLSSSYGYGHPHHNTHHQNMSTLNGNDAYSFHHSNANATHNRIEHNHNHTSPSHYPSHLASSLSNGSEHANSASSFGSVYGTHSHPHLAFATHSGLAAASNCSATTTNEINAHQSFFNSTTSLDHSGHHHQHSHQTADAFAAGNFNVHVPLWNGLSMLSSATSSSSAAAAIANNNHTSIDFGNENLTTYSSSFKSLNVNEKHDSTNDHDQTQQTQSSLDQYFKKRKLKHCTSSSMPLATETIAIAKTTTTTITATTTATSASSTINHMNTMNVDTPPASSSSSSSTSSSSSSSSSTTIIDEYNDNCRKSYDDNHTPQTSNNSLIWNSLSINELTNNSLHQQTSPLSTAAIDSNNNKSITADILNIIDTQIPQQPPISSSSTTATLASISSSSSSPSTIPNSQLNNNNHHHHQQQISNECFLSPSSSTSTSTSSSSLILSNSNSNHIDSLISSSSVLTATTTTLSTSSSTNTLVDTTNTTNKTNIISLDIEAN